MAQIGNILAQIQARSPIFNPTFSWDDPSDSPRDDPFAAKAMDADTVYDTPYDVLACIVSAIDADVPLWEIGEAWKVLKDLNGFDGLKITAPNDLQIERANKIRRYYRNKLTIQVLKSQSMSLFRVDLQELLHMDSCKLKLKFLPMMIRLPAFYKEDTVLDDLKKTTLSPRPECMRSEKETKTLQFLQTSHRKTKNQDTKWYWFVDDRNLLHRLSVDGKNKLSHVLEKFLDKPVTIEANYPVQVVRGHDLSFFSVEGDWRLL